MHERLWSSGWGRTITSHALHVFAARSSFIANELPELTPYLEHIEVTSGCGVEFPMVFKYREQEIRDPSSSLGVVDYP